MAELLEHHPRGDNAFLDARREVDQVGEARGTGELRVDVRRLRSLGQPPWPLRRKRHIGNPLGPERETHERPHRGELPRDRGRGQLRTAPAEIGGVIREGANVDVVQFQPAAREPGAELAHVDAIRTPRRIRQRRAREEPCNSVVHESAIRARASEASTTRRRPAPARRRRSRRADSRDC